MTATPPPRTGGPSPYLLLLFTMLFWAGNVVVGRGFADSVPPVTLAFLRWTVAFVAVLPFGLAGVRRDWPAIRQSMGILALLALLGVTVFNTLYYVALKTTEATNAAIVASIGPAIIPVIAWLVDRTRLSGAAFLGLLVAMAGVLAIVIRGDVATLSSFRLHEGDLWLLVTVTVWGFYSVLLRRRPPGLSPLSFLTVTFGIGLALLIPPAAIEYVHVGPPRLTTDVWLAILYVGLFPSVAAFLFWNRAVAQIGPTAAGLFIYLIPIFSAVLAWLFLGEAVHVYHLVGFALIAAGIRISTRTASSGARGPGTEDPAG